MAVEIGVLRELIEVRRGRGLWREKGFGKGEEVAVGRGSNSSREQGAWRVSERERESERKRKLVEGEQERGGSGRG